MDDVSDSLVADLGHVARGGPVGAEVPPLDEHVGRRHHPTVRCGDHRGVVAGAEQQRRSRAGRTEPAGDRVDEGELAQLADRGAHAASCVASDPDPIGSCPSRQTLRKAATMVVQAYILIQTEVGKAAAVAREIAEVKGVTLAEDVTGPYDVIVRAEARNVDELGKLVVAKVQGVDGITRTLTCPVVHL
jgi:DNA-binding Lrp family transcriptional regulator